MKPVQERRSVIYMNGHVGVEGNVEVENTVFTEAEWYMQMLGNPQTGETGRLTETFKLARDLLDDGEQSPLVVLGTATVLRPGVNIQALAEQMKDPHVRRVHGIRSLELLRERILQEPYASAFLSFKNAYPIFYNETDDKRGIVVKPDLLAANTGVEAVNGVAEAIRLGADKVYFVSSIEQSPRTLLMGAGALVAAKNWGVEAPRIIPWYCGTMLHPEYADKHGRLAAFAGEKAHQIFDFEGQLAAMAKAQGGTALSRADVAGALLFAGRRIGHPEYYGTMRDFAVLFEENPDAAIAMVQRLRHGDTQEVLVLDSPEEPSLKVPPEGKDSRG